MYKFLQDMLIVFSYMSCCLLVTVLVYYINIQNISIRWKNIVTIIGFIILLLVPIPYFNYNRNFGALSLAHNDYRAVLPVILLYTISVLFNYISVQIETIYNPEGMPTYGVAMNFIFSTPHYVCDHRFFNNKTSSRDPKYKKKNALLWLQFFTCWIIIATMFLTTKVPWDVLASLYKWPTSLIIVMGSGITTICMFMMIACIGGFATCFFNYYGGYNFKYYSDKPFLSVSIGEFWQKWNLWSNDWFTKYIYKPIRRKWKRSHNEAVLAIFIISGLIHAYCIALINWNLAWLAFFVFFINGVVVNIESAAFNRFPWILKLPTWLRWTATFIYLVFMMGLFGICFTKSV